MPGGRRRLANVRKLMRLAREYEREHGPDLRGFLELIAQRAAGRAAGARESEAPVEGEGLDAIRLMTIHRAKGLEFDTVCVADLGRSVRPPYELVRVAGDGRIGLRLARSGQAGRVSAWDYDTIGAQEREAEELEERRLFYVAMTRARERLILSGATRFEGWAEQRWTGGGPVGWIAPAFVPELAARLAEGGGEIALGGARVRLAVSVPEAASPGAAAPPRPLCRPCRQCRRPRSSRRRARGTGARARRAARRDAQLHVTRRLRPLRVQVLRRTGARPSRRARPRRTRPGAARTPGGRPRRAPARAARAPGLPPPGRAHPTGDRSSRPPAPACGRRRPRRPTSSPRC